MRVFLRGAEEGNARVTRWGSFWAAEPVCVSSGLAASGRAEPHEVPPSWSIRRFQACHSGALVSAMDAPSLVFPKPIPAVSTAQLFSLGGILQDHGDVGCVCPREPTGVHIGAAESATLGSGWTGPGAPRAMQGLIPPAGSRIPLLGQTGIAVPVLRVQPQP